MGQTNGGIVEVAPHDFGAAAKVLAEAFAEDPVFVWALPKAKTRLADAAAFFTFYLRRSQASGQKVYATADNSAIAVMTTVKPSGGHEQVNAHALPTLLSGKNSAADYFRWIETFRPAEEHNYLEFIGSSPGSRSKGQGTMLLQSLLTASAMAGLPVWCWSSSPRNLPFYGRLGFVAAPRLRRDSDTPPVTPLLLKTGCEQPL